MLHMKLAKDYPASVILIREKMKSVLGCTVRKHREWMKDPNFGNRYPVYTICLDFYNEPKRIMFLLKYSEFLSKTHNQEN